MATQQQTEEPKFRVLTKCKKTDFCFKCRSKENLTEHHVIPKTHKKDGGDIDKIILCRKCHDKMEAYILAIESFIGGISFGKRFRLPFRDYYIALTNFLGVARTSDVLREEITRKNKKKRRKN